MSKRCMVRLVAPLAGLAALSIDTSARAATVHVATAAELRTAIEGAKAGDEIVLADGTYATAGISCAAAGTAQAPIVVRAQNRLGARIDFDALEGFVVTGPDWHFEGLEVRGVCATDDACEHAFHVSGKASGFVVRHSKLVDFNAQLKVNASNIGGTWFQPNDGLVEYTELFDTRARVTSNPVTKVNIDAVDRWVVRGNSIHDFQGSSGGVAYGAFLKGGGKDGVFERNLVVCEKDVSSTVGSRVGLSFGGGGTAPQFCAPAFDAGVACTIESERGVMRNNIVVNCSDVGIYLNRSKDTELRFNTLIGTAGVDFRFPTTSGAAKGNVLTSVIRTRDDPQTPALTDNLTDVSVATFESMYLAPLAGDLRRKGDLSALLGKSAGSTPGVTDDYCARARPAAGPLDLGALQASLGDCDTLVPPLGGGAGPDAGADDAGAGSATEPQPNDGAPADDVTPSGVAAEDEGGCAVASGGRSSLAVAFGASLAALGLARVRRKRRF